MNKAKSFVEKTLSGMVSVGSVMMMSSAILGCINAIARQFFSTSFPWAEELCMYLVVMGFFYAIPYLELKCNELSVDILKTFVKNKTFHKVLFIIFGLINIAVFVILIRYGIVSSQLAYASGVTTNYLHIPKYILYGLTVFSFMPSILAWLMILLFNRGESF